MYPKGHGREPQAVTTNGNIGWIANYIWGIANDVLRDLYVRGKYRDVILPMTVLRRLDAVLEDTKQAVLDMKTSLDTAGVVAQDQALRHAAGQAFYNTSPFTLRDLRARASRQQLRTDFEAYLDGFSPNVQDILKNFEFQQPNLTRLSRGRRAGHAHREAHVARHQPEPRPGDEHRRIGPTRRPRQPRHGNHLRRAGASLQRGEQRRGRRALDAARRRGPHGEAALPPHRRPDQVGDLPALRRCLRHRRHADRGGGDLAAARRRAQQAPSRPTSTVRRSTPRPTRSARPTCCSRAAARRPTTSWGARSTRRSRTTRSLRANSTSCSPIRPTGRAGRPTLSAWAERRTCATRGSSSSTLAIRSTSLVTRSSDGQMLFLANKLSKMKQHTPLGSRIAEVHNGSSLFTGDAGQGESNIRRWIIENDWLEAIVALPLNMFYNTGIATYVWVITNRKPEHRRGQGAAHRRNAVAPTAPQEPRQEELRAGQGRDRPNLRRLSRVRGDRAEQDLRQRGLRVLEGDRRTTAAHRRRGSRTGPTSRQRSRSSGRTGRGARTHHP